MTFNHNHTCLIKVPIFNHLEVEDLFKITELIYPKKFKKDEILFMPKDKLNTLYILRSGQIKTYYLAENAKEHLLSILNPGDFIGEFSLFVDEESATFAEAMMDVEVCIIHKDDMQKLLIKYPNIAIKIISELSRRLVKRDNQASWIATEQVETRIGLYLLERYNQMEPNKPVELNMTKKDLASYLGTTPETLSRKLGQLEYKGFIRQVNHKEILIIDYNGLKNFMGTT
jgi:CRP/FNR family transcriptional regulator